MLPGQGLERPWQLLWRLCLRTKSVDQQHDRCGSVANGCVRQELRAGRVGGLSCVCTPQRDVLHFMSAPLNTRLPGAVRVRRVDEAELKGLQYGSNGRIWRACVDNQNIVRKQRTSSKDLETSGP